MTICGATMKGNKKRAASGCPFVLLALEAYFFFLATFFLATFFAAFFVTFFFAFFFAAIANLQ
ncbi:MAG: hypothetical protein A2341_02380 [Deltaproteobacteria bacterium RIFOXYB12_FULL_58_9]|nr:MAG: hypothetical protein A2341_02380 [Deltaproteobacteria bacterium RIFOXYB12_FULL_58_9]